MLTKTGESQKEKGKEVESEGRVKSRFLSGSKEEESEREAETIIRFKEMARCWKMISLVHIALL